MTDNSEDELPFAMAVVDMSQMVKGVAEPDRPLSPLERKAYEALKEKLEKEILMRYTEVSDYHGRTLRRIGSVVDIFTAFNALIPLREQLNEVRAKLRLGPV